MRSKSQVRWVDRFEVGEKGSGLMGWGYIDFVKEFMQNKNFNRPCVCTCLLFHVGQNIALTNLKESRLSLLYTTAQICLLIV